MRSNVGIALMMSGTLAVGIGAGFVVTHHHSSSPKVKVLGDKFTASTSGAANTNGNGNGGTNGNGNGGTNGNGNGQTNKQFTVGTGANAPFLYPAVARNEPVVLSNPNNFTILVTGVTGTVGAPVDAKGKAISGCSATVVTVAPITSTISIPANGTANATMVVQMAATAPNACKSAIFPISYSGTATK